MSDKEKKFSRLMDHLEWQKNRGKKVVIKKLNGEQAERVSEIYPIKAVKYAIETKPALDVQVKGKMIRIVDGSYKNGRPIIYRQLKNQEKRELEENNICYNGYMFKIYLNRSVSE